MNTKYLNPIAYYRKLKHTVAKLAMAIGISLVVTTNVDKFRILFWATSYKEYMLRAKLSYKREKVTMHWLRVLVDPNDVVYDIGANVGAYSLYAGNIVSGGNGQVLAFEPAFTNFFPLGRNIELNSLNQFVIPYSIAFGASTYATSMFLRSTERGEAMHGMTRPVSEGNIFNPAFKQGAFVTSVDEFIASSEVKFPNHIKIDVDGSESAVIAGMHSVMSDDRLKTIMVEIDDDLSQGEIERTIKSYGLEEVMIEQWKGKNTFNKLFARK